MLICHRLLSTARARSTSVVVSHVAFPFLEWLSSDIVENTVINGKDGVKALNLIHQACLTVPVAAGNGGKCVI
jgi:hypothetical protein